MHATESRLRMANLTTKSLLPPGYVPSKVDMGRVYPWIGFGWVVKEVGWVEQSGPSLRTISSHSVVRRNKPRVSPAVDCGSSNRGHDTARKKIRTTAGRAR